jgi:hypothetical protein
MKNNETLLSAVERLKPMIERRLDEINKSKSRPESDDTVYITLDNLKDISTVIHEVDKIFK